nr:hypothetical protein GCM10020092_081780 [Actinoplanes digitatis]
MTIFNQASRGFEFHPGPVFANIVIADEINRASPKTQSALLEVMEERRVTVDGVPHPVPQPFLVVATQNPVEMDGTYRLPEAQLDRFLVKLSVGYPSEDIEVEVLRGAALRSPDTLEPVTDTATVGEMVRMAQRVHIADPLYTYAVRLAAATRDHPQVRVGVSPPRRDRPDPGRLRLRAHQRPGLRAARGPQDACRAGVRAPRAALARRAAARGHRHRGARRRGALGAGPAARQPERRGLTPGTGTARTRTGGAA